MSLKNENTKYLWLAFLTGTVMLIYETYSIKVLFFFFIETTQAVAIALSAFLAGLAFSSLVFAKYATDEAKSIRLLSMLHLFSGLYAYFVLKQYQLIPELLDLMKNKGIPELSLGIFKFFVTWLFLFIPAFFGGGIFPILSGLYKGAQENKTQDVAKVYFYDTFGAIIGTLLAGFVLLTYAGLENTLYVGAIINLFSASIIKNNKIRIISLICFALITTERIISKTFKKDTVAMAAKYIQDERFGEILHQEESPFGVITVGKLYHQGILNKVLFINLREMCHGSFHYAEDVIGQYTVRHNKANMLNIGLGCGFTANKVAQSTMGHVDVVEINPNVASAAKSQFAVENGNVLEKKNVSLIIDDGAQYIRQTDKKYDGIVVDVEEVRVIHSSPLFTLEYFNIIKKKLNSNGIFSLWSPNAGAKYIRVLHNTLGRVFTIVDFRIISKGVLFFASDAPFDLPEKSDEDVAMKTAMLSESITDINTLNARALEKYFDIYSIFNLPKEYQEKTLVQ